MEILIFVSAYALVELASGAAITRTLAREFFRVFIYVELAAQALVRVLHRPRFVVLGACHQRGVCCTQIIFAPPQLFHRVPVLLRLALIYHRVAHEFTPVGTGPGREIIFRCGHLTPSGRCGIYRHRPLLCRNYPVLPYYEAPVLLPGCGFTAVPRVVTQMRTRAGLRILNPRVAVHHPTPLSGQEDGLECYELVAEEKGEPR